VNRYEKLGVLYHSKLQGYLSRLGLARFILLLPPELHRLIHRVATQRALTACLIRIANIFSAVQIAFPLGIARCPQLLRGCALRWPLVSRFCGLAFALEAADLRILDLRIVLALLWAFELRGIEFRRWECARAIFGVAALRVLHELNVAIGDSEIDLTRGEVYDETVDSR
jgi:hypothetical protein